MQSRGQEQTQASLDKQQYNEKDLITIKVPISLPYFSDWKEFEEYNGSIEVNGQHYNYVKRKVYNDTLILLCLPNIEQNKLAEAKTDFEKSLNTAQSTSQGSKTGSAALLIKVLLSEYNNGQTTYDFPVPSTIVFSHNLLNDSNICSKAVACPWQPPEIAA